jgi:hypothetical protein
MDDDQYKIIVSDSWDLVPKPGYELDFVCTTSASYSPGASDVRDYYLALNNGYVELWLSIDEQDFYENCWAIVAKQKISQPCDEKTMAIRLLSEAFDVEIQSTSINVDEAIKSISIIEFGLIDANDSAKLFDR